VASLAASGPLPSNRSRTLSLKELEDPKTIQATLQQFATSTNGKSQTAREPFTRSMFCVPTDGGEITLCSHHDVFRAFSHGLLADEKLTQADIIYSKFQDAEADTLDTCQELERKKGIIQRQMQPNASRLAVITARAAPAADDAPSEDIKVDPQEQSATILPQDPTNLALQMQMIDMGLQIKRIKVEHDRAVSDDIQKLNTHATTFAKYVEHAVENTCFSVLSTPSQSVKPNNFDTLTQIARSHGYDSQSSAYDQLSTLLDSLHANSRRVDLLFVYTSHAERQTSFSGMRVEEFVDIRRRERNDQDRYPLPPYAFQLMELIAPLDEATFGHLKYKYSSLSVDQVTKQTIIAAQDEILKIDSTKKDAWVTYTPPVARAARVARDRPGASSAAVTQTDSHSNKGGKSNFESQTSQGGAKQPYKASAGRYAPRTGDHHHGGIRRSQPPRSRSDELTRPSMSNAHLGVDDSGDEEQALPDPKTPAKGGGGGRGSGGGGRGGRGLSVNNISFANRTALRLHPDWVQATPYPPTPLYRPTPEDWGIAPPAPLYRPTPEDWGVEPPAPLYQSSLSSEQLQFLSDLCSPAAEPYTGSVAYDQDDQDTLVPMLDPLPSVNSRDLGHFPQPAICPSSRQPRHTPAIMVVTSLRKPDGTFKPIPPTWSTPDRHVPQPPNFRERHNPRHEVYALATQHCRVQQHFDAHSASMRAVSRAAALAEENERLGWHSTHPSPQLGLARAKSVAALHVYHPKPESVNTVRRRREVEMHDNHPSDFEIVVDLGTLKNLFPVHMLSNRVYHEEWICGVGSHPLRSPCKGTVRLLVSEPHKLGVY
jgi:hypothetical protein